MKDNAIKFLYAVDCYLLYLLSGVAAALSVVVYYSVRAAVDFGTAGFEFSDFLDYISSFLTGKSSVVLLISYGFAVVTVLIVFAVKKKSLCAYTGMSYISLRSAAGAVIAGISLNILVQAFLPQSINGAGDIGFLLLVCTVVSPFVEELIFRGILLKMFASSCGIFAASIITSVLFSITHGNISEAVYTFILGILLAVVRVKSTSLWSAVLLHLAFNITGAVLMFAPIELSTRGMIWVGVFLIASGALACSGGRKPQRKILSENH